MDLFPELSHPLNEVQKLGIHDKVATIYPPLSCLWFLHEFSNKSVFNLKFTKSRARPYGRNRYHFTMRFMKFDQFIYIYICNTISVSKQKWLITNKVF